MQTFYTFIDAERSIKTVAYKSNFLITSYSTKYVATCYSFMELQCMEIFIDIYFHFQVLGEKMVPEKEMISELKKMELVMQVRSFLHNEVLYRRENSHPHCQHEK